MRLIIISLFFSVLAKGQIDSALGIPLLGVHLGGALPAFDMAKRFGGCLAAGGTFMYKTKKNWVYGAEYNFMFGRNVKEDVLKQLKNSDGFVVDNEGYPADIRITERVVDIHVFAGRIFKVANLNPNSGLMVTLGAGYLQHKVNLFDAQHKVAGIKDNLMYGLDHLTSGYSINEFIGYLFLSENRMLNFYAGFQFTQAVTKSVRRMNYDTGLPDTDKRFDMLTGFRVGWILPLYKKKPNDFYYD